MAVVSILKTLEEGVYDLVLSAILGVKTLFRTVITPWKVQQGVEAELARPAAERYDGSVSPLLFLFLFGILPYLWLPAYFEASAVPTGPNGFLRSFEILFKPDFTRRFLPACAFFLIGPLLFSFAIQKLIVKKPVGRESFKPVLHGQALCFGAIYVLWFPFYAACLTKLSQASGAATVDIALRDMLTAIWSSMAWLIFAECCILWNGFRVRLDNLLEACLIVVFGPILWYFSMIACLVLFWGTRAR